MAAINCPWRTKQLLCCICAYRFLEARIMEFQISCNLPLVKETHESLWPTVEPLLTCQTTTTLSSFKTCRLASNCEVSRSFLVNNLLMVQKMSSGDSVLTRSLVYKFQGMHPLHQNQWISRLWFTIVGSAMQKRAGGHSRPV